MEFKDVEFKEGIHKSVRKAPREDEGAAEQIAANEPVSASEIVTTPAGETATNTPLPTPASLPERKRGGPGPWLRVVMLALIVCLVGGGVLVFQKLHTTQPAVVKTLPTPAPSLKNNLCAVTGARFTLSGPTALSSISALSASDVWAVGYSDFLPLVEHWDGQSWKVIPASTPNGTLPKGQLSDRTQDAFTGVAAIANNDAWAVGHTITNGTGHALIAHWDGSAWGTTSVLSDPSDFNSISAVSANDIWAVGTVELTHNNFTTLVEHWDGTNWSRVQLPGALQNGALVGLVAVAANDLWVSDYHPNTVTGALGSNTMLHWDGQQWTAVPLPALNFGFILLGFSALSDHDIWTAGTATGTLLIEHWNGTSWTIASNQLSPESFTTLSSIAAVADNNVWAVGGTNQLLVEHWDGKNWTLLNQPQMNGGLNAVANAGSKVWAVGDSQADSAPLIEGSC